MQIVYRQQSGPADAVEEYGTAAEAFCPVGRVRVWPVASVRDRGPRYGTSDRYAGCIYEGLAAGPGVRLHG